MRAALLVLISAAFAGCVATTESPLAAGSVEKGERTVVLVFPSPAPIMSESDSMADNAAKVVPGLSLMISATQNERDRSASASLQSHLPPWQPVEMFTPLLMGELAKTSYIGRFVSANEAGVSSATAQGLNHADDIIDWQLRYMSPRPSVEVPRDYASMPALKDALILEVNLGFGAPSDGHGNWTPELQAVTRLVRGSDNAVLWRHQDTTDDKTATRASTEFENHPGDLIGRYQAMMAPLASSLVFNLRSNLQVAGAAGAQ